MNGEPDTPVRRFSRVAGAHAPALAGFILLTLIVAWPVWLDPARTTFHSFSRDNFANFWNLWWVAEALTRGLDIFHTPLLYHPTGVDLTFTEFGPLYGLLASPLLRLFPSPGTAVLAHNGFVMLALVLNGFLAYRFAEWASGSKRWAFAAGVLYFLSPFLSHHREHLNLLSAWWVPLAAWLTGRLVTGASPDAGNAGSPAVPETRRSTIGLSAGLGLSGLGLAGTSSTILLLTAFFLTVWMGATLMVIPASRRRIGRLVLAAGALLLGAMPLLLPWFRLAGSGLDIGWPETETLRWSPDLLGFVIPGRSTLLGGLFSNVNGRLHGAGGSEMYLGGVFLALATVGVVAAPRRGLPLAVTAVIALLVSLGPGVWIAGQHHDTPLSPYRLLTRSVSVLAAGRTPARFVIVALVAMTPLAAMGLTALRARPGGRRMIAALLVFAGIEFLPRPEPPDPVIMPALYERLGADPDSGAVIELSIDPPLANEFAFHQLAHERPIVDGPLIRPDPEARKFSQEQNLYDRLANPDQCAGALADLRRAGVTFLVAHRGRVSQETWDFARSLFGRFADPYDETPERIAFRIREVR